MAIKTDYENGLASKNRASDTTKDEWDRLRGITGSDFNDKPTLKNFEN